ncbi:RRQRL motif-containing zinc-binding protein [Streptomyces sp. STR69]|uniref:RRQRL motif-containing zinc-binding protein n=1 Tax=Streptomyces sp. STR69 TaxID=1796942 RepID=UPI0021C7EB70|nr:RRQRL motif-containing zinc-binding protein [Streptomyces sp. STR69]
MGAAYAKCYDPNGVRFGIPTFPWRMAPDGYATRRQLRAKGLRPGGQHVSAQVLRYTRHGYARVAYLYRVTDAKPVRPMTSRKWGALALAMLARRTCPQCQITYSYCIPRSLGTCVLCAYPAPNTPAPAQELTQ